MQAMTLPDLLHDERTHALLRRLRGGAAGVATQATNEDAARLWWLDAGASDQVSVHLVHARPADGGGASRAGVR